MGKARGIKRRRTSTDPDAAGAYKKVLEESANEDKAEKLVYEDRTAETEPETSVKGKPDKENGDAKNEKAETREMESKRNVQVIVLLDNANLEAVKLSGKNGGYALLNCDEHQAILRKHGKDANDARPDITHQCLLALLDSPLNKAGKLKVYIHTKKNVLIEVNPQIRIPRTIKRFSGLMVELLHKMKIRGTSGSKPLLKLVPNPFTAHLPVGARKILCTYNCDKLIDIQEHAKKITADAPASTSDDVLPVLYIVGAMAHGKVDAPYAEESICISDYPLSAATVCSKIAYAYESLLGIF